MKVRNDNHETRKARLLRAPHGVRAELLKTTLPTATRLDGRGPLMPRPLQEVYEINERCLELLVQAARSERLETFFLVKPLREVLREMTPETRARAARRAFLLVDLEFANADWWRRAKNYPTRSEPLSADRGTFPRPSALQLARSTLTLAWHSVRADRDAAGVMLGMNSAVASLIASLSVTEIDPIVERRFRHVRPRWDDRPSVWWQLLRASQSENIRRDRDFNVRGLQLIAGALMSSPGN